ncbi:MAG: 30S ribosomal protein S17 [Actinobacteria bacterium]|nr:MAG: 30S ribosomal protein S17 [Actinomycetota bacterium]
MVDRSSSRKTRVGVVVSDKMDKTVVVAVRDTFRHPLYGKTQRRLTKYKAHDDANTCGVGDLVRISETRPLSKTKRWRVAEVLEKAK